MPEKDKNTLFKRIIFRKYKDEINWVKMINYLFKERKIFEEDVAILTKLFNEKNNDWLKKFNISEEDAVILTKLFNQKINNWLEKEQISEDNVLDLTDLFNEKMNINDETTKVIEIAKLLKKAEDLNRIHEILDELPPRYFSVDNWEDTDEEDIENESKIMIAENSSLNKEETVSISNSQKAFSKQDIIDSGICLDDSLSTSELVRSFTVI
ncbi:MULTISPECIES: hypothetical protein [unclassified Spiroplasma]|uniref:hypothetical protein n=1 Tax=unclassified Spiroplasma TaxID=2637901 RepID=UPI0030CF732B